MYKIGSNGDDAAAIPPPVACQPDLGPRWIRVGRGTYPFGSYADASVAYRATIQRLGLGVSEAPACEVLDEDGNLLARVAYNGRVFAVGLDGECDYTKVLYETGGAGVLVERSAHPLARHNAATCPTRG